MATKVLSCPEKEEMSPEGGPSPQIILFEVCYDAGHHINYSEIIAVEGGLLLSVLRTWPPS